jgi:hypothetical protein
MGIELVVGMGGMGNLLIIMLEDIRGIPVGGVLGLIRWRRKKIMIMRLVLGRRIELMIGNIWI